MSTVSTVSPVQVHRLDHVAQSSTDTAAVLDYYLSKLAATKVSEWNDREHGPTSLLAMGGLPIQIGAGPDTGWHSIGWTVPAPAAASTISKYGLTITVQTEDGSSRPTSVPAPAESPFALTGPPTVSVRTHTPDAAAAWLAELVGGQTFRQERKHLNTVAVGVSLPDHTIEFVASLTGSEHDLVGTALIEHGEGIHSVRLRTSDFFHSRRELAAADVRFSQMGNLSLLLEAEGAGGAILEIFVD